MIADLGSAVFLEEVENTLLTRSPGAGTSHLTVGIATRATHAGHEVCCGS